MLVAEADQAHQGTDGLNARAAGQPLSPAGASLPRASPAGANNPDCLQGALAAPMPALGERPGSSGGGAGPVPSGH